MAGFYTELAQHGVQIRTEHQVYGQFTFDSGYAAARQLLTLRKGAFSAVFCANDVMAMAAIQYFTQAGVCVPQDLSVMGYDDAEIATYTTHGLTTVHVPLREVATHGCRHLLNLCYGLNLPVQRSFPPHVVWRGSVAPGPASPLALDCSAVDLNLPA